MTCMKCGRELEKEQAFCDICQEEMKKYPVKPGIPVQIPPSSRTAPVRKPVVRRRAPSPEEQIKGLKKRVRALCVLLLITTLLVLAMIQPTVQYIQRSYYRRPGQNYTTITPGETTRPRR